MEGLETAYVRYCFYEETVTDGRMVYTYAIEDLADANSDGLIQR